MVKHKQTKKTGNATATETAAVPVEEIEPVQVSAIEPARANFPLMHPQTPRGASFPGALADAAKLRAIVAARSQAVGDKEALTTARAFWRELLAKKRAATQEERERFAQLCAGVPEPLRPEIYKAKG